MVQSFSNFIFNAFEATQLKFKEPVDLIVNNLMYFDSKKFSQVKQKNLHEDDSIKYYLGQLQQLLIELQMMPNFIITKNFHSVIILLYLCQDLKFLKNYNFNQFFLFSIQIYSPFQIYFQHLVIISNYLKFFENY